MKRWISRVTWMVAGVAAFYATMSLAAGVQGGPLDPPGPASSTMLTLDSLPPTWFRSLRSDDSADPCTSSRFNCVLSGDGVLDKETGLVWRRTADRNDVTWFAASAGCSLLGLGTQAPPLVRLGWRLPTAEELLSLYQVGAVGALPGGHPFNQIDFGSQEYWTATDNPAQALEALTIGDYQGGSGFQYREKATGFADQWCVRGPA